MPNYPKRGDVTADLPPYNELVKNMEKNLTPIIKKFLMQEKELAKAQIVKTPKSKSNLLIILELARKGENGPGGPSNKWFPKWEGKANIELAADSLENINKIDSNETVNKVVAVIMKTTGPEKPTSTGDVYPYPVVINNEKFKKGLLTFDLFEGASVKDGSDWNWFDYCYQWKILSSLSQ